MNLARNCLHYCLAELRKFARTSLSPLLPPYSSHSRRTRDAGKLTVRIWREAPFVTCALPAFSALLLFATFSLAGCWSLYSVCRRVPRLERQESHSQAPGAVMAVRLLGKEPSVARITVALDESTLKVKALV